jgi:prepilin-type processing-associated H-X9-DG protein
MVAITAYTNDLSGCWALRDVDQQVDIDPGITWTTQISPTAIHGGDLRNVIYFDWHAQAVHGTNYLLN